MIGPYMFRGCTYCGGDLATFDVYKEMRCLHCSRPHQRLKSNATLGKNQKGINTRERWGKHFT